MEDVPGFRYVASLEGAERERASAVVRGRDAAWRRRAGMAPVPARQRPMCPHPLICRWVDEQGAEVCRACGGDR